MFFKEDKKMGNDQNSIKKARELFLKRGIMKRESLREEVAYSWARSQLINLDSTKEIFKIQPLEFFKNQDEALTQWGIQTLKEVVSQTQILAIAYFDEIGNLKKLWSYEKNFGSIDYSEKEIGSNGIGLSQKFREKKIIFGYEHYHESFSHFITMGIPVMHKGTAGFVFRKSGVREKDIIKWFEKTPEKLELKNNDKKSSHMVEPTSNLPACLVGNSELAKKIRERLDTLQEKPFFYISGASGMGKETLAYFLHKKSTRRNLKFYAVYCDKIPFNRFKQDWLQRLEDIDEKIKKEQIGTIYFDSVEALPIEFQKKFLRILDSKSINNKDLNDCSDSSLSLIVSTKSRNEQEEKSEKLLTSLQNRFGLVEIKLHSLNNRKEDACLILEQMLNSNEALFHTALKGEDLSWEEIKRLIMCVKDWDNIRNLRALEKVAFILKTKSKLENKRDQIKAVLQLKEASYRELTGQASLEKVEKETIIKAMEAVNFNVTKASGVLGISRSTLYRKLKTHNIEKMSHNETEK